MYRLCVAQREPQTPSRLPTQLRSHAGKNHNFVLPVGAAAQLCFRPSVPVLRIVQNMSQDAGAQSSKRPRGADSSSSSSSSSSAPQTSGPWKELPADVAARIMAFSAPLPERTFTLRWATPGMLHAIHPRALGRDALAAAWKRLPAHYDSMAKAIKDYKEARGEGLYPPGEGFPEREARLAANTAAGGLVEPPPLPQRDTHDVDLEPQVVHELRVWRAADGRARGQRSVTIHAPTPAALEERLACFCTAPRNPHGSPPCSAAEASGVQRTPARCGALQHTLLGPTAAFGHPVESEAAAELVVVEVMRVVADFWGGGQYRFAVTSTNTMVPSFKGSLNSNNMEELFGNPLDARNSGLLDQFVLEAASIIPRQPPKAPGADAAVPAYGRSPSPPALPEGFPMRLRLSGPEGESKEYPDGGDHIAVRCR